MWTQLTNDKTGAHLDKYKPLLEKYPSEDQFIRISVHDKDAPIEESALSINGKQLFFDDLNTETIKDSELVRSLVNDIKNNTAAPNIDEDYFYSDKPMKNIGLIIHERTPEREQREKMQLVFHTHSTWDISRVADLFDSLIQIKYFDSFNK
jgi:hypothetical protein